MKKINQGKQKVLNYINDFIESEKFQETTYWLRKKFRIPKNGFKFPKKIFKDGFVVMPRGLIGTEFNSYLKSITDDLLIDDIIVVGTFLKIYIVYNTKYTDILFGDKSYAKLTGGQTVGEIFGTKNSDAVTKENYDYEYLSLCKVEDIKNELELLGPHVTSDHLIGIIKGMYANYPVVIKLHPSMSQRDLIDYIKHNWAKIKCQLNLHKDKKSKLGNLRTRNVIKKELYDLVYRNQKLSRKELYQLVNSNDNYEKFGRVIGAEELSRIISLENKRRN
jgi:hypothetical protein